MTMPFKKAGYPQGIYEQASTCKCMLGEYRMTRDGCGFRYGLAAEALTPGKMSHATQLAAAHLNEAILAAVAVGTYAIDLTVTAGTAIAADELRGGYFMVRDEDGQGQKMLIAGNTAITNAGTAIQIGLDDPIKIALTTDSEFDLVRSPWYSVQFSTTDENFATGVPMINITSGYYGWFQTHGVACALIAGTPAVGTELILSATEGALAAVNTTKDIDVPTVGYIWGAAGVDTEYCPVFLTID
ncbi:MAG: hypothetical protein ABIH23_20605 [bacterium]